MRPPSSSPPLPADVAAALGPTGPVWQQLTAAVALDFPDLRQEWKPTKLEFGRICLLKQENRTLLYLIPHAGGFEASLVLGERAVALALAGELPAGIKSQISAARRYAEGRGIRFPVTAAPQIAVIRQLVAFKTAPK